MNQRNRILSLVLALPLLLSGPLAMAMPCVMHGQAVEEPMMMPAPGDCHESSMEKAEQATSQVKQDGSCCDTDCGCTLASSALVTAPVGFVHLTTGHFEGTAAGEHARYAALIKPPPIQ